MRLLIVLLSSLFISANTLAGHSYSGAVFIFSESESQLATYTHGFVFDERNQKSEGHSTLKIYNKMQDALELISTFQLDEWLTIIRLVENSNYLVGISNLDIDESPDIVIYDMNGKAVASKRFDCAISSGLDLQLFCPRSSELEQTWFNQQVASIDIIDKNDSIRVCFNRTCIDMVVNE